MSTRKRKIEIGYHDEGFDIFLYETGVPMMYPGMSNLTGVIEVVESAPFGKPWIVTKRGHVEFEVTEELIGEFLSGTANGVG